jgi:hypothetical protein
MKKTKLVIKYYAQGIALALLIIGIIHLYSFVAEPYFSYASAKNIIATALLSGVPFGITIFTIKKYLTL